MSHGAETFEKTVEPRANAGTAGARPAAPPRTTPPRQLRGAVARPRSETTTLTLAVTIAVALGVACGVWINSMMASSAASAGPTPETRAASPHEPAPAAEPRPGDRDDAPPPADETGTSNFKGETADASRTDAAVATDGSRAVRRAAAMPVAREATPAATTDARPAVAPRVEKRAAPGGGQVRESPCALYSSAGALTVRGGGAAPLILGGPGEAGRVTVTTPDWSDIAVFNEGRAGGNGWLKFSVRSVSKRPGVYTVRFTTPCGSKTIPVTVTRP